MLEHSLHQLSLDEVIQGCRAESNQPRTQEAGYCFELFRRALEEQEQAAWQAIDQQYRRLILHWIHDYSPGLSHEKAAEIVPDALPKFWYALTRSATPLAGRFAHVGAVLKYLKQCTISVFQEHERRIRRRERVRQRLESPGQLQAHADLEEELLARIDRERLLRQIQKWVNTYVTDLQEQRVLSLSYEYGLTPAEIAERYPQEFADAQSVRRLKERILKRARRALGNSYQDRPYNRKSGLTTLNQTSPMSSNIEIQEVAYD